jgi:hypothetical protein
MTASAVNLKSVRIIFRISDVADASRLSRAAGIHPQVAIKGMDPRLRGDDALFTQRIT